jgi:hypothetical protein
MKYLWITLLLPLVMASTVPAQQPVISADTPVNSNILHQWLNSGDPRLIAWAADFARRTHDTSVIAEMPRLLESGGVSTMANDYEIRLDGRKAVLAVLDCLIQENSAVSTRTIRAVATSFPTQAIILIARLPLSDSRGTLREWTSKWSRADGEQKRIAAMILAKNPDPDFVASVVGDSEEALQIFVIPKGFGHGGSSDAGCGDSLQSTPSPGWPQIYDYDLVENYEGAGSYPIVDLDNDRISFRRHMEDGPWGSCNFVQSLDASTRHRLIAYWLGVHGQEVPWQAVESVSIVWKNKIAFHQELGATIDTQHLKLRETVESLRRLGLLTDSQAGTITPKLVVTIECDIKPCPLE